MPLCKALPKLKRVHFQYHDVSYEEHYTEDEPLMEAMRAARDGLEVTDGDYCG